MLTITNYVLRESQDGNEYQALELTSDDPEMVLSASSGRYYMTIRKAYIPATFSEEVCQKMIGRKMPGSIVKTECEPYEFTVPETGEVIERSHRYDYSPLEAGTMEQAVFQKPAALVPA